MVVTHSPGNPFAFSPAQRRPAFTDSDAFQHYRSPSIKASPARRPSFEDAQRSVYAQKEYEKDVAQEKLLKEARIEELEKRLIEDGKKLERAESDKRWLFEKEQKQAVELAELKEELAQVKKSSDGSMRELRLSYNKLKDAHLTLEDEERATGQAHERELEHLRTDMENQRRAMSTLRTDLTTKNDMLVTKNQQIEDLERRVDEQRVSQVSGSAEDLAFVTKQLADAIAKVTTLEATVTSQMGKIHRLQEANVNIAVLKEEKATLETKLKSMDSLRDGLASAQVRLAQLEQERTSWLDLLGDGDASDISAVLARQKSELEAAKIQRALIEGQLDDSSSIISTVRQELNAQTQKLDDLATQLASEKKSVIRLERSKALATREVNFLRDQLKSYDLEEQVESPNFDPFKATRIAELESMLDQLRQQISEQEAQDTRPALGTKRSRDESNNTNDFNEIERGEYLRKIRSLNADLEITRKEDALLRKEMESLRAAQQAAAQRILQHRQNPTTAFQAIRSKTLQDLKIENDALLAELAGKGGVTVPIQSLRNAETELSKSAETIRQKEKMMQRLKEVFSAKSSEFREAVYSLLGYKLDFLPNGRVRLTSMYAEKTDHAFLFDGEAGTMQLSGERQGNEAFMDTVGNLIKYWSGEKSSIPGMLSALTLELLEKESDDKAS